MSQRSGTILFGVVCGALMGFYVAICLDKCLSGWTSEWPTVHMLWMPLVGAVLGFWIATEVSEEPVQDIALAPVQVPISYASDLPYDIAIEKAYTPAAKAEFIQERMNLTRTGRLKMKGKNYGDAFKELMEGSDPLDT